MSDEKLDPFHDDYEIVMTKKELYHLEILRAMGLNFEMLKIMGPEGEEE
jgi:hypothetical protein|tara:strand:- start:4500 stop:4646 length:147 start_codon:yes stop_codon:yes gene_type:complete